MTRGMRATKRYGNVGEMGCNVLCNDDDELMVLMSEEGCDGDWGPSECMWDGPGQVR